MVHFEDCIRTSASNNAPTKEFNNILTIKYSLELSLTTAQTVITFLIN